jgi:hypothetical protein
MMWRPRRNTIAAAPFQEEYRAVLRKHGAQYEERYVGGLKAWLQIRIASGTALGIITPPKILMV